MPLETSLGLREFGVVAVIVHVRMALAVGCRSGHSGDSDDLRDPFDTVLFGGRLCVWRRGSGGLRVEDFLGWRTILGKLRMGSASFGALCLAVADRSDLELGRWVGRNDGVAAREVLARSVDLFLKCSLLPALGGGRACLKAWACPDVVVAPLALRTSLKQLWQSTLFPAVEKISVIAATSSVTIGKDESARLDLIHNGVEIVLILREDVRNADWVGAWTETKLWIALGVGVVRIRVLWIKIFSVPAVGIVNMGIKAGECLAVLDALGELSVLANDITTIGVAVPLHNTVVGRGTIGRITGEGTVTSRELERLVEFVGWITNVTVVHLVLLDRNANIARAIFGLHVQGWMPVNGQISQVLPTCGVSNISALGLKESFVSHLGTEAAGAEQLVYVCAMVAPIENGINALDSSVVATHRVKHKLVSHCAGGHGSCRSSNEAGLHR